MLCHRREKRHVTRVVVSPTARARERSACAAAPAVRCAAERERGGRWRRNIRRVAERSTGCCGGSARRHPLVVVSIFCRALLLGEQRHNVELCCAHLADRLLRGRPRRTRAPRTVHRIHPQQPSSQRIDVVFRFASQHVVPERCALDKGAQTRRGRCSRRRREACCRCALDKGPCCRRPRSVNCDSRPSLSHGVDER